MTANSGGEISRRHFLASTGIAVTAVWLGPRYVFGQEGGIVNFARNEAVKAEVKVQALRRNISVLMGAGGNIAVLPGRDGKLIIDAGYIPTRPKIAAALAQISGDPIKHLVNTNWHFEHTDGNEWMHSEGATIIAHENTHKHLSESTLVKDWKFTFPPSPAGAIPTEVFKGDHTLHFNGTTVSLEYYGPSHTDSDISVHFHEANVFHTGDTCWNGVYPFIDYSTGGSVDGMIRAANSNLTKMSADTIVIPGHGPVANKSQLVEYRNMLTTIRERVAALKKEGKSVDETVAAKPTAAYDAKWGGHLINGDFFTKLVYQGV